ncbi:MAG: tail fiber domain-containing protein [Deltaproteobacteria bacterium]|nr:tail fiber domain-containing protein [Deltaproteobacteria bacterium]
MNMKTAIRQWIKMARVMQAAILVCVGAITPTSAICADKLLVKNPGGTTTFKVEDNGSVTSVSSLFINGASAWGSAPFVLGQNLSNRGLVITNKAPNNQKNIYMGWNVGSTHEYAEIFALHEGVAYKNLVLNPSGGFVGIGNTSPSFPLQMGSGAYVSAGGVWTNASSREYKKDIEVLAANEAMDAVKALKPVKFRYKVNPEERHVGFIAEEVPEIASTRDRKGMSPMDVVALLTRVVQDQQKIIEELSEKVARLEALEH